MAQETREVTRRGFIEAIGAIGVAGALPMFPTLAQQPGRGHWTDAASAHLATLRAAYLAEIARFAATLRPRFEAGELYAMRDADLDMDARTESIAHYRIEDLCRDHFGLRVEEDDRGMSWTDEQEAAAHQILSASPHAGATSDSGHHSPLHHATEAAGWDVIAYARAQRWYVPTTDEQETPCA